MAHHLNPSTNSLPLQHHPLESSRSSLCSPFTSGMTAMWELHRNFSSLHPPLISFLHFFFSFFTSNLLTLFLTALQYLRARIYLIMRIHKPVCRSELAFGFLQTPTAQLMSTKQFTRSVHLIPTPLHIIKSGKINISPSFLCGSVELLPAWQNSRVNLMSGSRPSRF